MFSSLCFSDMILSDALILTVSQLQTQQVMTSPIRLHIEYLIQTYYIFLLILQSKLLKNSLNGRFTYDLMMIRDSGYSPNSTWLDSTRLDTTRHVRRVEPVHFGCVNIVEQHSSTRSRHDELDWLDLLDSTRATRNLVCCVISISYDHRNSCIV